MIQSYLKGIDLRADDISTSRRFPLKEGQLEDTFNNSGHMPRVGSQKRYFNANTESKGMQEVENNLYEKRRKQAKSVMQDKLFANGLLKSLYGSTHNIISHV